MDCGREFPHSPKFVMKTEIEDEYVCYPDFASALNVMSVDEINQDKELYDSFVDLVLNKHVPDPIKSGIFLKIIQTKRWKDYMDSQGIDFNYNPSDDLVRIKKKKEE